MKKMKAFLIGILSVCTLFCCTACGGGGIEKELDLTVQASGIEVSGEELWRATFEATKAAIEANGCEIEAQGAYDVSMFTTENTCKMKVIGTENGVTKADVSMRESFPLKSTNEKSGQMLVENGKQPTLIVDGVSTQGNSAIGDFYRGEYSVGILTYQVCVALMRDAARDAYSYVQYDPQTTAYIIDEENVPPVAWDKLNENGIQLDDLDFKIWMGEGKVLAMTFELKASSEKLMDGVAITGTIKGKYVLNA